MRITRSLILNSVFSRSFTIRDQLKIYLVSYSGNERSNGSFSGNFYSEDSCSGLNSWFFSKDNNRWGSAGGENI